MGNVSIILPRSSMCMVYNKQPNHNYDNTSPYIGAINYGTNFIYAGFVNYDTSLIQYLASSRVVSAKLWVKWTCDVFLTSINVSLDAVQNPWLSTVVTYNNQPPALQNVASFVLTLADNGKWESYDVTNVVKQWIDNPLGENGFKWSKPVPSGDSGKVYPDLYAAPAGSSYIEIIYDSSSGPTNVCNLAFTNFDDGSRQGWGAGTVVNETPHSSPYCLKVQPSDTGLFNFGPTTDSFRLSFFINPKGIPNGQLGCIFAVADTGYGLSPRLYVECNAGIYYLSSSSWTPYQYDVIGQLAIAEWNQVVLDFDAMPSNFFRAYINGIDYGKFPTSRGTLVPPFTHDYYGLMLNYVFGMGYILLDDVCIRSPVPAMPPVTPPSKALEQFPSSVRIGTRLNQRTRRGRGNG